MHNIQPIRDVLAGKDKSITLSKGFDYDNNAIATVRGPMSYFVKCFLKMDALGFQWSKPDGRWQKPLAEIQTYNNTKATLQEMCTEWGLDLFDEADEE